MKCRLLKENGIEIELSRDELHALDITYDKLDYANVETRRVLWTVLDEARAQLGSELDLSGKMLIEAKSDGDGGCVLDFTLLPYEKTKSAGRLIKRDSSVLQFESDNINDVLDVANCIGNAAKMSLYENNGKYRILCKTENADSERIYAMLTEFGSVCRCNSIGSAATREHWRLLSAVFPY